MQDYTIHFLFKIFLSFGLFLILNSQGSAQNIQKIDSLKALIANSSEKDKIKILNELGWEYRNSHFLEALEYINQAITLAEPIADYEHLSQSYNFKGVIYRNLNVNRQAMESFYKALTNSIRLQ
jgi:tetratricopeptide (TPR) repeat protein